MNEQATDELKSIVGGKKVLYVATKNKDYLRLEQEIILLNQYAREVDIIAFSHQSYTLRLLCVYFQLLFYFKCYDVAFIGFTPQLTLPFFIWKFKNKEIVIDFFISLYDTFIFDRKKFDKSSMASKFLKKIDTLTLSYADYIVCDTKAHSKYFNDEFNVPLDKMIVLYLSADLKYYYPRHQKKPENLKNCYVVLYFGSVLPLQGIDIIIDMIGKIKEKEIFFIVIGPVSSEFKLGKTNNSMFIDWLSQKELAQYIAFSDLCLAGHFNDEIEKAKRVIPGKAYIYEAMQKKMILGDNSANRERYPKEYSDVSFVTMGDSDGLANTIRALFREWREQ